MKTKIISLCVMVTFLCLQSALQVNAGVSDIKKKLDKENNSSSPNLQPAAAPAADAKITSGESLSDLLKKAELGDAKAQYHLGLIYCEGNLDIEKKQGIMWLKKAAEQGYKTIFYNARVDLGDIYSKHPVAVDPVSEKILSCVPENTKEAFKWYTKAAEQEDANAQIGLGLMYQNGKGVAKNPVKAVEWFTKAVEQGVELAQKNLDILCKESPWACK